ncbi:MAG: SDR family oxidoreductase [Vicinamibacterales bacterium]
MPTILVTGASSGFGHALCIRLARCGWQVFGASRTVGSADDDFVMLPVDVRSDESVAACVAAIQARAGAIDVLVNNAGYVHEGPLEEIGVAGLKAVFETNFFGVARMVDAVLPVMRAQRRGRIINVGSVAGLIPLPFYGAYCASKHALEGYTEALHHEVGPLGIEVAIVEPAFYRTRSAEHKLQSSCLIPDYEPHRSRMLAALAAEEAKAPAPDPVVRRLERLVTDRRPIRLRNVIGKYTFDYWLRGVVPERIWHRGVRIFWQLDRPGR